jgi:hypothetical protein
MRNKIADSTATRIVQAIVVIVGFICIGIVFIVDKMGAILQVRKLLKYEKRMKVVGGSCEHSDKPSTRVQGGEIIASIKSKKNLFYENDVLHKA